MTLQSRNLIIDTSYFVSRSLNFTSKELASLGNLVTDGLARVYLTDITETEIKKKISDLIGEAYTKINHSDTRYLKSIPLFRQYLEIYSQQRAVGYLVEQFEAFKRNCQVEIIPSDSVKVMQVFHWYMEGQPPFNDLKRNEKKHEFPDAFALASIAAWIEEGEEKAYLLSNDRDWSLFSEQYTVPFSDRRPLTSISDLSVFTDLVLRTEESLKDEVAFADSLLRSKEAAVLAHLLNKIEDAGFVSYGPEEEELCDIFLLGCSISDKELVAVTRMGAVYSLELEMDAIVVYDTVSYEGAIWDPEDHIWRGVQNGTAYSHQQFPVTVEVELAYEDGLESDFEIGSEKIPDEIEIPFEEDSFIDINEWTWSRPVIVLGVLDGTITQDGTGKMEFDSFYSAQRQFPELDINSNTPNFTKAMGNKISEPLRFETCRAQMEYGS